LQIQDTEQRGRRSSEEQPLPSSKIVHIIFAILNGKSGCMFEKYKHFEMG
jgi:hypothetical protein